MVEDMAVFAAVGFVAQMIDGAIGMAYGLSATSVLLALGVAPATASASVHAAEVFTTGASGLAHWRLGNVRRALVLRLAVPGVLGGVLGAYVLVGMPTAVVRVFVGLYLLALGGVVLLKALRPRPPLAAAISTGRLAALGFCGGLLDAIGGGGWGAIVTATLIGRGSAPCEAIGSASLAEFFVTVAVPGGVPAAPLAALVARRLPARPLMAVVGIVVSLPALRGLLAALGATTGVG
jgi:uncharacterized protein